jgi:hypothetical protein
MVAQSSHGLISASLIFSHGFPPAQQQKNVVAQQKTIQKTKNPNKKPQKPHKPQPHLKKPHHPNLCFRNPQK